MHGVPTYVEQLAEMFHRVIVDGSSSCILGSSHQQEEVLANEEGEDPEGEGFVHSPLSSNSRKRTTSTADTAASPAKKSKSPMMKMFQGLISELQVSRTKDESTGRNGKTEGGGVGKEAENEGGVTEETENEGGRVREEAENEGDGVTEEEGRGSRRHK